ncbi:MAG: hypothetical protein DI535_18175 [Citrobacter freundii]|nr:MAG: hypothetical protein DI535_18175 [Citrobacter freundii]
MKKLTASVVGLLCSLFTLNAQNDLDRAELIFGIYLGANKAEIKDLKATIMPETFFTGYTLDPSKMTGFSGGFFVNRRFDQSLFGLQLELNYGQYGSSLHFNNSVQDFYYDMDFKYEYVSIAPMGKFYFGRLDNGMTGLGHLYIGAGAQFGTNIASDNIFFTGGGNGWSTLFGSSIEQQQQLRNVLKGRSNFGLLGSVGYEFVRKEKDTGFTFDFRYHRGISDVLETMPNSYNFAETKFNRINYLQAAISFFF